MELSNDFKEFIELLNVNKVKYLVVVLLAVRFHANPQLLQRLSKAQLVRTDKQNL